MVVLHNLFDTVRADSFGSFRWLWGRFFIAATFWSHYPEFTSYRLSLVPWIGVMAAGYGFGSSCFVTGREAKVLSGIRQRAYSYPHRHAGANVYGDPARVSTQRRDYSHSSHFQLRKSTRPRSYTC